MTSSGYATGADGVRLYYEVLGDGPPLLVLQGGSNDARATAALAGALAPSFTVVTHDRRGLARSDPHAGGAAVTMGTHADDAAAVLAAVAPGPALVVGTSIGALVGLHLLVAHPERVAHLVAHEPPMSALVGEPERERQHDEVEELARAEGPVPAIRRMAAVIGLDPARLEFEPGVAPPPPSDTAVADLTTFFAQDFTAVRAATLVPADVPDAVRPRLTPAGGTRSRGAWEYRCAQALALGCGRPFVELPGAHNGVITHPRGTAEALATTFAAVPR